MAVPGLISAGSSIHRLVQPGLRRSRATVKLGAVARESCFGSPVMWHFRQGALTLANNCRAMVRSASVSGSSFSAMNGCACQERASKKRTSLRISPSEKLKLGILAFRYWRTPSRFVSLSLSAGLLRKRISHWGLTRARPLIPPVRVLVLRHALQHAVLPGVHLVAAHAVVLADHPPAVDDVLARIGGVVEVARRHGGVDRAFQQGGHGVDLGLGEVEVRHLQAILAGLLLAGIVDGRVLQLVLEEALVGVPALLLRLVAEQREIQALEGFGTFLGEFGASALLLF